MPIVDRDLGWRSLVRRLRKVSGLTLTVGIHPEEGNEIHEGGKGVTVAEVGAFHEFGAGNNPQRSWLRETLDMERTSIAATSKRLARGIASNRRRLPSRPALDFLGQFVVQKIKARMRGGIPPALQPSTIARKEGGTTPLIDTEQLIDAITHKVKP